MNRLSTRERLLLGSALVLGIGAAVYSLAIVPQGEARARALAEIARFDAVARHVGEDGVALPAALPDTRPVPAIVAESARDAAIPIRRLEPEGALTRLTLDAVGFTDLMTWLADLDTLHAIRVASVEMERQPEPGVVTARLALER